MGYGGVTHGTAALATPINDPPVLIHFEGLLIGHYEGGIYYVGVLPTLGHQFSVLIEEFVLHTTPPFREPISKREIAFEEVPRGDRTWSFDVQQNTTLRGASTYVPPTLFDRMTATGDPKDYRWAMRLENGNDFPAHAGNITIEKNALRPVIQFKHGVFHNRGHVQHVFRVPEGGPWVELGAISARIAANLETLDANAELFLRIERAGGVFEEIFRITYQPPRQYIITIRNTSLEELAGSPLSRSHFQIYYLAAHTPSENRYDLRATSAPAPSGGGVGAGAPNPYRCGIGDVEQPIL